jgi:hypothetical protein
LEGRCRPNHKRGGWLGLAGMALVGFFLVAFVYVFPFVIMTNNPTNAANYWLGVATLLVLCLSWLGIVSWSALRDKDGQWTMLDTPMVGCALRTLL